MAEFVQSQSSQLVLVGQNLLFLDSIRCPKGYVIHDNGSGVLTLRGITGCNPFARYQVTFNGNIAIPTDGTVAAIAAALTINGEELQYSRAIVTPAAVEQFFNVTCTRTIVVPRFLSVVSMPASARTSSSRLSSLPMATLISTASLRR